MPTTITQTDIPHSLNGWPVKAFSIDPQGQTALVLVHRETNRLNPWVAATWWPELETSWQWGNYFASYERAEEYRGRWIATKYGDYATAKEQAAQEAGQ